MKLLSRNEFRKQVFERDNYKCVICKEKAQDAHHIIDNDLVINIFNQRLCLAKMTLEKSAQIIDGSELDKIPNKEKIILNIEDTQKLKDFIEEYYL